MNRLEQFLESKTITRDMADLFLGKEIGGGIARTVFECRTDPTLVVKIEDNAQSFHNILEWETWQIVEYTPEKKWFAPCVAISPCGTILLMKKAEPLNKAIKLPKKLPVFLTDIKKENFGLYEGRVVCFDYGLEFALRKGLESKKTKKAEWHD